MTAQTLGWGPPGCTRAQLVRVQLPGMIDGRPYFPLMVRREAAPLFVELCRWLVAERARLGLPPLTCSGGYNKRLIRGSSTAWSNHSWALAGDFCVATNPMRAPLRTDMPPGTAAKAASLGMVWGGTYRGRPDPMHFEVVKSPADVARIVAGLGRPTPAHPHPALIKEDDMAQADRDEIVQRLTADLLKVGLPPLRLVRSVDPGHRMAAVGPGYYRHLSPAEADAFTAAGLVPGSSDDVNDAQLGTLAAALGGAS